jgi:hypothetical protein|tara:strand:+ start:85 stop:396 length:312 start_codon:yes stop_codon:yes gene_type:complete
MSKMGAFNLRIEEYTNYLISQGDTYDQILESVQKLYGLSDYDADEVVWKLWTDSGSNDKYAVTDEDYDRFSHGVNDMSDDADALASAGFGTDEDYGGYDNEPF